MAMKKLAIILVLFVFAALGTHAKDTHYTVIVSLDGCRWDYPQWYDTPFFDKMATMGVESGLIPSFPSKTFPNHYALATGLYPDHHGIIANEFLDRESGEYFSLGDPAQKTNPKFYGGEPIWVTAKKQGIKTAVFYWPGSDVKVKGMYPDIYYVYDQKPRLSPSDRINGIISQLKKPEKERPHLIMAYFEQPDANGHAFGPQSKETRKAVVTVDSLMHELYDRMQQLPIAQDINFIVVSDHGMTLISKAHAIPIAKYLKKNWVIKESGSIPCNIYVRDHNADSVVNALKGVAHLKVWKKQEIPAYLHYGSNSRVGDVVALPDIGYCVTEGTIKDGGQHGFDPNLMDMHAMFRAIGPDFQHVNAPHFKNVNVYPLLCFLLGIQPAPNDGQVPLEILSHTAIGK